MVESDEIADRLRREAEAVERRALLESKITALEAEVAECRTERETLVVARDSAAAEWAALWEPHGVTAGDPVEMETWYDDFRGVRQTERRGPQS